MRSTAVRCDQIIALIDACLADVAPGPVDATGTVRADGVAR
jgi:hypothetical protein